MDEKRFDTILRVLVVADEFHVCDQRLPMDTYKEVDSFTAYCVEDGTILSTRGDIDKAIAALLEKLNSKSQHAIQSGEDVTDFQPAVTSLWRSYLNAEPYVEKEITFCVDSNRHGWRITAKAPWDTLEVRIDDRRPARAA